MKVKSKIVSRYEDKGRLKAVATVCLDGKFLVTGVRVADCQKGLAVFMPSREIMQGSTGISVSPSLRSCTSRSRTACWMHMQGRRMTTRLMGTALGWMGKRGRRKDLHLLLRMDIVQHRETADRRKKTHLLLQTGRAMGKHRKAEGRQEKRHRRITQQCRKRGFCRRMEDRRRIQREMGCQGKPFSRRTRHSSASEQAQK